MQRAQVAVVGAGVAGVACARVLHDAGLAVRVLDRGRVPGGRAASRTLHGRRVDLGASYLTARSPGFTAVVEDWVARGLARPWTESFAVAGRSGWSATDSPLMRYGTPGGIRTLVEDLAVPLDVRPGADVASVTAGPCVDGLRWDAVVLAVPDAQALDVLDPGLSEEQAVLDRPDWEPALSLAAGFGERSWDLEGVFVQPDHPVGRSLSFVADDGRRRGDGAPVLVAHSTPGAAAPHLDDPQAAVPGLVAALRDLLDLPEPLWTYVQRWSLARPAEPREQPFHLGPARVGLCGDGWGSPRFETAWTSGTALGTELLRQLG
jgi:renalase